MRGPTDNSRFLFGIISEHNGTCQTRPPATRMLGIPSLAFLERNLGVLGSFWCCWGCVPALQCPCQQQNLGTGAGAEMP